MFKNKLEIIILDKPNLTDFSLARNNLLKDSKADWILFIDSDERLTPELDKEIEETLKKDSSFNGFYIKRKIVFLGITIGQDKVLRLAKKGQGKWVRAVHEIWKIKGTTNDLKNYLIHDTATDLHQYISKINKYSNLHAKENLKERKRSNLFKIIFFPIIKFLQNFISGRGFVFSMLQSFHSFLAWSQLWILQKE